MKRISKILSLFLLICSIAALFTACAEDPYKDYVSSGLEPKTKSDAVNEQNHDKWFSDTELKLFDAYSDYEAFGIDLGYTEEFFELNSLLIFLRTGCSSDNLQFVDIWENNGKLYPVLERNYIGPNDPVTEDIIFFAFYAEIPDSASYSIGEVINRTRKKNFVL